VIWFAARLAASAPLSLLHHKRERSAISGQRSEKVQGKGIRKTALIVSQFEQIRIRARLQTNAVAKPKNPRFVSGRGFSRAEKD
jgi:hypothetical protein